VVVLLEGVILIAEEVRFRSELCDDTEREGVVWDEV
jgi:hypothetical protein